MGGTEMGFHRLLLPSHRGQHHLDCHGYLSLLKAFHRAKSLTDIRFLHAHLVMDGHPSLNGRLGNHLVITLAKCGALHDAHTLLHTLHHRSINAWTSLISGYADIRRGADALEAYHEMLSDGLQPDHYTYVALFKTCGSLSNLAMGVHFHEVSRRNGFVSIGFVRNTLVRMYGKCGSTVDAEKVFQELGSGHLDVVSWNAMLSVYVEHGHNEKAMRLFRQLVEENVTPDHISFVNALQACGGLAKKYDTSRILYLEIGRALHADARREGLSSDVYVRSTFLIMYGKCGGLIEVENVFNSLCLLDVVTWNAMFSSYVELNEGKKVLQLYSQMQREGVKPNQQTLVIALQACGILAEKEQELVTELGLRKRISLQIGEALYVDAAQWKDFMSNSFVSNSLLTMFGRCGNLPQAEAIFEGSSKVEIISWNAMLSAYIDQHEAIKAITLYRQLCEEKEPPNHLTFVIIFQACGILADKEETIFAHCGEISNKQVALRIGQALHADARRNGCSSDMFVNNTLVSMYGKCGSIKEAECVFVGLPDYNIVACNAMISAYVDNNVNSKALQLYSKMLEEDMNANKLTFVLLLQACIGIVEMAGDILVYSKELLLELCHALDAIIIEKGLNTDVWVRSTLISMYGKCGVINKAQGMLDEMPMSNVVPWNAMLSSFVEQDQGDKALELYNRMQERNITITDITILCVLQACGGVGCLEVCREIHFGIACIGYDCNPAIANTIIFAYGNCGNVVDATMVFDAFHHHPVVTWNSCIAGHSHEGNCLEGICLFEEMHLEGKEPDEITYLSLLTMYSHTGLIDDGVRFFEYVCKGCEGGIPDMKHYAVLIDMLGRAGALKRVHSIVMEMPMPPSLPIWLCVMSSCRTHGDVVLGELMFDCAARLYPTDAALYVLMANLYSDIGCTK